MILTGHLVSVIHPKGRRGDGKHLAKRSECQAWDSLETLLGGQPRAHVLLRTIRVLSL